LHADVNKSSQQVGKVYNLTSNLTLSQTITNVSNAIEVVFPVSTYNISSISCIQNGINVTCLKYFDDTNHLCVNFTPFCSTCPPGTVINFIITNLINPSFINTDNQLVIINTRTT
jgi:hypothetical protein